MAFAGSNHQQSEPSLQAQTVSQHKTFPSSPSASRETSGNVRHKSHDLTASLTDPKLPHEIFDSRVIVPFEVPSDLSQQRHDSDFDIETTPSNHKRISGPSIVGQRLSDDGYHWRKYGQKQIKGSEFPRSYYKCTHSSCPAKKQLERSQDGLITEISYKGEHNHPKPQSSSQIVSNTSISIEEELCDRFSFPSTEEKVTNEGGLISHHKERIGTFGQPPVVARNNNAEGADLHFNATLNEVHFHDVPKSKHRCIEADSMTTSNSSRAVAAVEVDSDELGEKEVLGSGAQEAQSNNIGSSPSISADRLWGDGYNWRKYGQKQIKGSEFPRSYYRCTHPDCQAKKQLERTHDGLVTEIIYKGKHDHPKPQPSSHMAVGRYVSIQEERSNKFCSLNNTKDVIPYAEPNETHEFSPVLASDDYVEKEGIHLEKNCNVVEADDDAGVTSSKERTNKVSVGLNHQPSDQVESRCHAQTVLSPPSSENENMAASSHELTLTITVPDPLTITIPDPPVYMVTSKGIVPVEVDSNEACKGTRPSMALERLLENAYHWRKYGQKNIKGSEFPRSYYRCTHPNCQVKMQLVRSHDGRITEIVYRGKHDHPKPQPSTRMAVGAILSFQEERSDPVSSSNNRENKSPSGHEQTSFVERNAPDDLCLGRATDGAECAVQSSKKIPHEAEDDNDPDAKRRKRDIGDVDLTQFGRANREPPRVVVETLCETDVVDDGYRWCKYGRKMVKGNPNPRNYFKCSSPLCFVKKHVERSFENPKVLVTTYEGNHNHDLPSGRVTSHDPTVPIMCDTNKHRSLEIRSEENDAIRVDSGVRNRMDTSPENGSNEQQQSQDTEIVEMES
ncbi:hypothetical protein GIB67_011223 [Kingdonia uniflora]|uniref:WRKY domain-containing protein n=1 Tax=Kingdonia uniflora TaxID=39325 RepID=A0A7J7M4B0_9MAGN|nr:hypothetical protein GIB67_011223 [Kingdonia uniflora]